MPWWLCDLVLSRAGRCSEVPQWSQVPRGHQEVTWRFGTGLALRVLMPSSSPASWSIQHLLGGDPALAGVGPSVPSSEDPQVWPPQGSQIPAGPSLAPFTRAGGAESRATPRTARE